MKPGALLSQSAQVRIGICDLSSEPGLVSDRPLVVLSSARSTAKRRSMVAADIEHSWAATVSVIPSSPCRRSAATRSGSAGTIRLPVGPSSTAQQYRNASITSGHTGTPAREPGAAPAGRPRPDATPYQRDHDASR